MKNQTKVIIENNPLPTIQKPRILGVTFDIFFIFTEHIATVINKIQTRKNLLKKLSGTSWDAAKKLLTLHKRPFGVMFSIMLLLYGHLQ